MSIPHPCIFACCILVAMIVAGPAFTAAEEQHHQHRTLEEYGNEVNAYMLKIAEEGNFKSIDDYYKDVKSRAENGDALAQYFYAAHFLNSKPRDLAQGNHWLLRAAEQDYAAAETLLGSLLMTGDDGVKNYLDARRWLTKAANQNLVEAQSELAELYYHGQGGPVDYQAALKWYLAASDISQDAWFGIGRIYFFGNGIPRNYSKAREWFIKAANSENKDIITSEAAFALGAIYLRVETACQKIYLKPGTGG